MADRISIDIPSGEQDQTKHDQEMVKKAEEVIEGRPVDKPEETPSEDKPGERPSWLPEKFKSPEDMAKAYGELEKKFSQGKPEKSEDETPLDQKKAEEVLQAKGLDFDAFSEEFLKAGGLSEDSYRKLEEKGIPRSMVDSYIEGQQLIAAEMTKAAFAEAGGEENYKAMVQWAKANLSQPEIDAFNKAVYSTKEEALLAIRGLHSKYSSKNGSEPNLVTGNSGPSVQSGPFRSIPEMQRAMADPRYKSDEAYRQDVISRLAKSSIF